MDPFWPTRRRGGSNAGGNWPRTLGDEQFRWLEKTLAESKSIFKFVFIHHPAGGMDEFRENRPGWPMPIHQLLVKHKVSVVFHGHDHFFAKQDLDGVVCLLVPQPGHPNLDRLRSHEEYGYKKGDFLPPAGHVRVRASPDLAEVVYVRSYPPRSESAVRENDDVSYSFKIMK